MAANYYVFLKFFFTLAIQYSFSLSIFKLIFESINQGSSGGGEGFEVTKFGHGRVALIGFPRFVPLSLECLS